MIKNELGRPGDFARGVESIRSPESSSKPRKRVDASADNDSWVKPGRIGLREIVELPRPGEQAVFSDGPLIPMLELSKAEIRRLVEIQESIL